MSSSHLIKSKTKSGCTSMRVIVATTFILDDLLVSMSNRELKRVAQSICTSISSQLSLFLGSLVKQVVMQRVLSNLFVVSNTPNFFKFSKQALIEQDVVLSLV